MYVRDGDAKDVSAGEAFERAAIELREASLAEPLPADEFDATDEAAAELDTTVEQDEVAHG